jgi:hypothetical protein
MGDSIGDGKHGVLANLDNKQAEVEEILNDHTTSHGLEYLVHFKGHMDRHNQWVPVNDMQAPGLISHFERGRWFAEASTSSAAR